MQKNDEFKKFELKKPLTIDGSKFINNMVQFGVEDDRIQQLIIDVWSRIPAHDQAVLMALVIDISDIRGADENVLGSAAPIDPTSVINGNAGDSAIDLLFEIKIGHAKKLKSDEACMAVIAHEFAHVVLRHAQLAVVIENLENFEPPFYTFEDENNIKELHEDEANLQVWVWGFDNELKSYFEECPESRRPRWFQDFI